MNKKKKRATATDGSKKKQASPWNQVVQAVYLNDASLHGATGKLKCRLDHHGRVHLPVPPTAKKPVCACHRWAGGRIAKISGQILQSNVCSVNLCVD